MAFGMIFDDSRYSECNNYRVSQKVNFKMMMRPKNPNQDAHGQDLGALDPTLPLKEMTKIIISMHYTGLSKSERGLSLFWDTLPHAILLAHVNVCTKNIHIR